MKPEVSIIIPHLNDVETLEGVLDSLYSTIDVSNFEVIVIDDGSRDRLSTQARRPNMTYISHFVNLGVGQAFDTGVRVAKSENLIIMGADIMFDENGWCSRMLKVIDKEQKSLVCTTCKSYTTERVEFGADILFTQTNDDISKNHWGYHDKKFRGILQGKWRKRTGRGVYPIPCLMGAFYGVKKSWYEKVRGFENHYRWGSLESYISLKSWRLGGKVMIDTDNVTMHIWRSPQRKSHFDAVYYNQLLTAGVPFGRYGKKFAEHLSESTSMHYNQGAEIYKDKYPEISELAGYIEENSVMSAQELEELVIGLNSFTEK